MAQCSDCYNGCIEIVSDKCVKYTGVDVPALGIKKGDSLSYVEQALITFLTATINGTGIEINIAEEDYCSLVSDYLQACETVTALDLFTALVKAACNLQGQITTINATLTTLNADYDVDCLSGVTDSSDTHAVVQAIITKLCAVDTELTALALDLETNYVKLSDLNDLIAAYIASTESATRYSSRMVPYAAIEYYGSLAGFDATGAGIVGGLWEDIYLCNGANGTPDHRGRVGVGATSTPGLIALGSAVDPTISGNPTYSLLAALGANTVTLDITQIPSHNHTITDPGHTHDIEVSTTNETNPNGVPVYPAFNSTGGGSTATNPLGLNGTESEVTGISLAAAGGGLAHNNYQPGIGCYFIMYIPA